MVRYYLICKAGHTFDGWFKSIDFFEKQMQKKGSIVCPLCGSKSISKQIIAPSLVKKGGRSSLTTSKDSVTDVEKVSMYLNNLSDYVKSHFEYVGSNFKDVAIDMHKGKIKKDNIYGEVTSEDATELSEEGIEVFPIGLKIPSNKIN